MRAYTALFFVLCVFSTSFRTLANPQGFRPENDLRKSQQIRYTSSRTNGKSTPSEAQKRASGGKQVIYVYLAASRRGGSIWSAPAGGAAKNGENRKKDRVGKVYY